MSSTFPISSQAAVAALRRQWTLAALAGFVALGAIGVTEPLFLALALPVWGLCLGILYRGLEENRREGDRVEASLGLPTVVTLARGALIAIAAGGLVVSVTLSAAAYSLAAILDDVDGRIARRLKRTTRLGARLDMELDALGVLVAVIAGTVHDKLPPAYLAVGVARYLFAAGLELRRRLDLPVRPLDPSRLRRLLAGSQMGFLAVALWPAVPASTTHVAAILFGGATLLMFARDWRYASGATK